MKLRFFAAAAAAAATSALFLTSAARAAEFDFLVSGYGYYFPYQWQPCEEYGCEFTWKSTLIVDTAGSADGVYTGNSLELIELIDPRIDIYYYAGEQQTLVYGVDATYLEGVEPGASVTISSGKITSIDFKDDYSGSSSISASGLSIGGLESYCDKNCDAVAVSGTLTPIPEPATAALMLGGLAILSRRRLNRAAS